MLFEKWREAICDECLAVCGEIIEEDSSGFEAAALSLPKPSGIDDFLAQLSERPWKQLRRLLPTPPSTRKPELPPSCSFCGDASPRQLIAGFSVFICDRCVAEGTQLLEQGSRVIEFHQPQVAASDSLAPEPVLSDAQRGRVLDAIRDELRRRPAVLSSAMQLAAATAGIETTVVDYGPDATMDPDAMLSSEARDTFNRVAPLGFPVHIVGGTSQGRRRLALGVHERSRQPGPFVRIDCASPGSLARMREAADGTLFLDDVPLLSAAAQELLEISLSDDPALRLSTRIVSTAPDLQEWGSRIELGTFSKTLFYALGGCTIQIGR